MSTQLDVLDTTMQKTHLWLKEIEEAAGWSDQHKSYLALRAVLHALRDRLTIDEGANLSAQLPMLVRGIFYEGWHPAGVPQRQRNAEDFLASVAEEFPGDEGESEAERMTKAVFQVLERNVTEGEMNDIKQALPLNVRKVVTAA